MNEHKIAGLSDFYKLSSKQRKAVKLLFEGKLTIKEIASELRCGERTIYTWKSNATFMKAQREYSISQLDSALPLAIQKLIDLINHGKSEMVKLQAIQTVLKRAGLFADNSTPELDKARVRKLTADARLAEVRASMAERLSSEENEQLDIILDKLVGEADNESKKSTNK